MDRGIQRQRQTIDVAVVDGIATVTLDRPDVLNAFDDAMLEELAEAWSEVRRDDEVRVVVLTGRGDRAFCSGYDRAGIGADEESILDGSTPFVRTDPGEYLGPKACGLWKPIIGAVNGLACGGAFYLLGECDLIVAADHATFFDPHLTFGMPAVLEPMHLLQRIGLGEVLRLALLGGSERMSATTAQQIGLVNQVVAGEALTETAREMARVVAAGPPRAVQATLRSIWAAQEMPRSQALALGAALVEAGTDPEALEAGQDDFKARRATAWRLR